MKWFSGDVTKKTRSKVDKSILLLKAQKGLDSQNVPNYHNALSENDTQLPDIKAVGTAV